MSAAPPAAGSVLLAPEVNRPAIKSAAPSAHANRFTRIDVLRGTAALTIVIYHLVGARIGWHFPWREDGLANLSSSGWNILPLTLISLGWSSVPLFFALSGFCIHSSFLRQHSFDSGVFFWRRFWRIYPAFLVSIGVFCFWPIWHLGNEASPLTLLQHVTTAFTLAPSSFWSQINPSLWSVAVEWQCYLLYPVFLWLRSRHGIAKAAFGWFVFALIGKLSSSALVGWPDHAINFWSCASFFSFGDWALGALVAEDLATKKARVLYTRKAGIAVLTVFTLSILSRPTMAISFSLASLVGALVIRHYASRANPINRVEGALAAVGLVSYSLYLWHQPLLGPFEKLGRELCAGLPLHAARLGTYLVMGVCLAFVTLASYQLLERPGIKLSSRLRSKQKKQ